MSGNADWKWVSGFGWKTGVIVGGAIGFQEGFLSTTVKSGTSTKIPLTRAAKFLQVYATPVLAEMILWAVICLLGGLALRLVLGRLFPAMRTRDGFAPVCGGVLGGLGYLAFVYFFFNYGFQLGMLFDPSKMLFNLRLAVTGLLVGLSVGFLVRALRGSPRRPRIKGLLAAFGLWILVLTPAALWINRVYLKFSLDLLFFGVAALFLTLLAGGVWLLSAWLTPRYRDGAAQPLAVRHLGSIVILIFTLFAFLPILAGPGHGTPSAEVAGSADTPDRNVIIISVDTLRADRVPGDGSGPCATPNFDRLAEEGVIFTRAQAPSSWTLSSIASMHTSMYPSSHGVLAMHDQLDSLRETLAEKVAAGGFLTAAVVSNGWLLEPFGAHQGFQIYDHMKHRLRAQYWNSHLWFRFIKPLRQRIVPVREENQDTTADCTINIRYAMEFLEANRSRNFLFWLHVIDPHEPYVARGRWMQGAGQGYKGALARFDSGLVVRFRGGQVLELADRRHVEDLYNREVEYTDMVIGQFLDKLRELGLMRNTLVIFTSDHGEEFWEHDNVSHGHTCFTELVDIPLIIRPPDEETVERNRRIEAQVSLVDLAPTALDYLGLPGLDYGAGISLLPMIRGTEMPLDRPAFYEAMAYYGEKKAVCDGRYKYVLTQETGREELYDLLEDPGEQRNLVHTHPDLKLELKGMLLDHLNAQKELAEALGTSGEKTEIDAATRAHLEALGYLH
jgi:arylsulfatase A-like enzyme